MSRGDLKKAWENVAFDCGTAYHLQPAKWGKVEGGFGSINYSDYEILVDNKSSNFVSTNMIQEYLETVIEHEYTHGVFYSADAYTALEGLAHGLFCLKKYRKNPDPGVVSLAMNLFADLMVDLYRSKNYSNRALNFPVLLDVSERMAKKSGVNKMSSEYKKNELLFDIHWKSNELNLVRATGGNDKLKVSRKARKVAGKISELFRNRNLSDERTRLELIDSYLEIVEPYLPDSYSNATKAWFPCKSNDIGDPADYEIPDELLDLDPEDFKKLMNAAGTGSGKDGKSYRELIPWYRAKARSVTVEKSKYGSGGHSFDELTTWEFGEDEFDELHLFKTLESQMNLVFEGGIGVKSKEVPEFSSKKKDYNLLLVLDSSGSMNGHSEGKRTYHANIGAFSLLQYARENEVKTAGINFNNSIAFRADWKDPIEETEAAMVWYSGGGTTVPFRETVKLAKRGEPPVVSVIISDMNISNESSANKLKPISRDPYRLVLIKIGSGKIASSLRKLTPYIYRVKKPKDLDGLMIGKGREWLGDDDG